MSLGLSGGLNRASVLVRVTALSDEDITALGDRRGEHRFGKK